MRTRLDMIDNLHEHLSIRAQCDLLGVHRSSYYYEPCSASEEDLALMLAIDKVHHQYPFYGQQWITSLKEHDISISMDGKGRAIDNIAIERFFRSLKYEEVYINPANTVQDLRASIQSLSLIHISEPTRR